MAGRLRIARWSAVLVLAAGSGYGYGQNAAHPPAPAVADPTRPPAGLSDVEAPVADAKPVAAPAGLQTVIMRKGAKPLAVINGQTVELGGKLGDARLVKLSETEAVLQGPNGKEVLRMTPDVERVVKIRPQPESKPGQDGKAKTAPKKSKSKLTK